MKLERSRRWNPAWFVIVPTFNVFLVVIGYFALSRTFVLQPGIAVRPPASSFALSPQMNPLLLSVTLEPVLTLFLGDRRLSVAEFEQALDQPSEQARPLIIKADRNVPYELVMQLANAGLERGLDVALAAADPGK